MSLTNSEKRRRASKFIVRFEDVTSEAGEKQTFYNEFFDIFGKDRKTVAQYEKSVRRLPGDPPEYIDLLWPRVLLIEHKSAGKNLDEADNQADDYYMSLDNGIVPRYILTSDFQNFRLRDLEDQGSWDFTLKQLPKKLHLFPFMDGKERDVEEEAVSIRASKLMDAAYKSMRETGYNEKHMGLYLTRLAYCMFAEDSEVFEETKRMFIDFLKSKTDDNGSDLGEKLDALFATLNTPKKRRQITLDSDMKCFPYINGGLFSKRLDICSFTKTARKKIIKASEFNWRDVSPSIFGSMFEGIMKKEERRLRGSHYTSTENVLRVIKPLFLDELYDEFNEIINSHVGSMEKKLLKFQTKLSKLKFLDPACGSGSFLITTYKELRKLELDVIRKLYTDRSLGKSSILSKVNVDQFYGIELDEFPARITETAMWMTDHQMNMELVNRYEGKHVRIPLMKQANIHRRNALTIDWNKILKSDECSYILGNPPFHGASNKDPEQRKNFNQILGIKMNEKSKLDYVCAWFIKSAAYMSDETKVGLVTTSSITQGEQIGQLWPHLTKHHAKIIFAYKPFYWKSDSLDSASVVVSIIGLGKNPPLNKRLFSFDENGDIVETAPKIILPYIYGSSKDLPVVKRTSKQLNKLPNMRLGSKIVDGGHWILNDKEKEMFLECEPQAEEFIKPYINADDFINGKQNWVFVLHDISSKALSNLPNTLELKNLVKEERAKSPKKTTRNRDPLRWEVTVIPSKSFLVIPATSSENRDYIPIGFVDPPVIPSNATMIVEDATVELFGLLTSKMHMAWTFLVGGRLKMDPRYSGMVYNTFPAPSKKLDSLREHAQVVLECRREEFKEGATLADMYDRATMSAALREAHRKLDIAVDRLYRKKPFLSDDERVEFLLIKYEKMYLDGLKKFAKPKRRKTKKSAKNSNNAQPVSASNLLYRASMKPV